MNITDYSWSFGYQPPLGKNHDQTSFRSMHAEFKKYLYDLQTSEFFNACSYFNLTIQLNYNGKPAFTLHLDKEKFTLRDLDGTGNNKSICLEKFSNPPCTSASLAACVGMFKTTTENQTLLDKYNSFLSELDSGV